MNGEPPIWLKEDAEIGALLSEVLDRFDRQPGDARQRNVSLPAERYLNSLSRADAHSDQTWALVRELERLGVLTIRAGRRGPYDPEWKDAKLAFIPRSEAVLREWLRRERTEPAMQSWRRAVQARAGDFPGGCEALLGRRIVIAGRSPEEVVAALASLGAIGESATLRQLSAAAFWGDSKILDGRGDLVAALFPTLQVRERPLVVAVHLPGACEGVLFIENQDTYTAAASGLFPGATRLALVYAAGFRGAATRVRSHSGALLHYGGPGTAALRIPFEHWWYDTGPALGPSWFWGDLDFAGMQILKSLRGRFVDLTAWRPGYEPMLLALRAQGGYSPASTDKQGQTDPSVTGCMFADTVLLPAIRQHGQLDQEWVKRGPA